MKNRASFVILLNEKGVLPQGIHDCSIEEVAARFGGFQQSDRRPQLWAQVMEFLDEVRESRLAVSVLINGSFATGNPSPNDIDLILVVPSSHDFARDLSPAQYNVLSAQRVKRRHRLDLLVAMEDSDQYWRSLRLFQQVRLAPGQTKGKLRVTL